MLTYALAADVGGTFIKFAIIGADGSIATEGQRPTPQNDPEGVMTAVADGVQELIDAVAQGEVPGVTTDNLTPTVGVAVPGIVDEERGIGLYSVNLGWTDLPIGEVVSKRLGRPVSLGHDVRSGALGEFMWGALAGVNPKHGFYLAIGTGIYSVTLIDGKALCPHPWTGEVGQAPIAHPDGGDETIVAEQACSAAALAQRVRALEPGLLADDAGAKEVFELADQGNATAKRVIESGISILADTIAQGVYLMGPVPVVIGGGLSQAGEEFFRPLRVAVAARTPGSGAPDILPAVLKNLSQAMGCAARAFTADGVEIIQSTASQEQGSSCCCHETAAD